MTVDQLQRACAKRIAECFDLAEEQYGRKFNRPWVTFSNRMTACAGIADYRNSEIRLSLPLLKKNQGAFIADTPGHEAAHFVAREVYGDRCHGASWAEVMRLFGQDPKRCHSFARGDGDSFDYMTDDGVVKTLSKIRHNKLQRGKVEYYQWKDGVRAYARNYVNGK